MKFSLIFSFLLIFSFPEKETFETYDWSSYKSKSAILMNALGKVVEANIIIYDHYNINFEALPARTKSQLAILQDAAFAEWLLAEEAIGIEEATKYWNQSKAPLPARLSCYKNYSTNMLQIIPASYQYIKDCNLKSRTACHLDQIKILLNEDVIFRKCLIDNYGDSLFTFTKDSTIPQ